jgi:hypothetical protein
MVKWRRIFYQIVRKCLGKFKDFFDYLQKFRTFSVKPSEDIFVLTQAEAKGLFIVLFFHSRFFKSGVDSTKNSPPPFFNCSKMISWSIHSSLQVDKLTKGW